VRPLVALLGLLWALANLGVAYLFFTSGIAAKNVHKGLGVQASLVLGAVLVAVFAALLLAQGVSLARSRRPD
jgi:fucose permease